MRFFVCSKLTFSLIAFSCIDSASKGIVEKEFAFSLDFFDEVVPEVRPSKNSFHSYTQNDAVECPVFDKTTQ